MGMAIGKIVGIACVWVIIAVIACVWVIIAVIVLLNLANMFLGLFPASVITGEWGNVISWVLRAVFVFGGASTITAVGTVIIGNHCIYN